MAMLVTSSMVVEIVDVRRVARFEAEDHAPVRPHRHTPEVLPIALESVQPKSRKVHIRGSWRAVKDGEDVLDLLDVVRTYPLSVAVLEESFQAFVPEALNHRK
jgi:hypothetical protein